MFRDVFVFLVVPFDEVSDWMAAKLSAVERVAGREDEVDIVCGAFCHFLEGTWALVVGNSNK